MKGFRDNIEERIELVLQNIHSLKTEYSNVGKVDEKFIFIVTFIAKNVYILKRQLKYTYDQLYWEEMEFCLASFVSSYTKQQEINVFYSIALNKSRLLGYLENFAKELETVKHTMKKVDISNFANLPNLSREEVLSKISSSCPHFEELYYNYKQIRDIHSLEKMNDYIRLGLSANSKERIGQLVIIRVLQAIGEYLKNTLESPKLCSSTSELLLLSLPENTRIVTKTSSIFKEKNENLTDFFLIELKI